MTVVGLKAYLLPGKGCILFAGDVTRGQQSVTPRNLYSHKAGKQRQTSAEVLALLAFLTFAVPAANMAASERYFVREQQAYAVRRCISQSESK